MKKSYPVYFFKKESAKVSNELKETLSVVSKEYDSMRSEYKRIEEEAKDVRKALVNYYKLKRVLQKIYHESEEIRETDDAKKLKKITFNMCSRYGALVKYIDHLEDYVKKFDKEEVKSRHLVKNLSIELKRANSIKEKLSSVFKKWKNSFHKHEITSRMLPTWN